MNTYDNIQWRETDFHAQKFCDATEFFDMLHIKSTIIPVVPLKHSQIIPKNNSTSSQIIGAYEFDRKTNQNAYIIQRIQSFKTTHYRLIQAERTYDHWNIGGILTRFHLTTFEAQTLNDLVIHALPSEILEIIYKKKSIIQQIKASSPKKDILADYGRKLLKIMFKTKD